jgi:hypothetical protein
VITQIPFELFLLGSFLSAGVFVLFMQYFADITRDQMKEAVLWFIALCLFQFFWELLFINIVPAGFLLFFLLFPLQHILMITFLSLYLHFRIGVNDWWTLISAHWRLYIVFAIASRIVWFVDLAIKQYITKSI